MADAVTLTVDFNNPTLLKSKSFTVDFCPGMTIHQALLETYDRFHKDDPAFTFDLRYSGSNYGYFVQAMYDIPTTVSTSWKIFLDGVPASKGVESVIEKPGVIVTFRYDLDQYVLAA